MTSGDQKIAKIQTHFQALSSAATSINTASDELTKVVGVLDEALRKLNIGLTVWVTISSWSEELRNCAEQIGYCKVNGKWGIALRYIWSDDSIGEDAIDGLWLFNDAPRDLRLAGIDKIPEVVEALGKEAFSTAKRIQEKTLEVRDLANAVTRIVNEPKIQSLQKHIALAEASLKKQVRLSDQIANAKEGGK